MIRLVLLFSLALFSTHTFSLSCDKVVTPYKASYSGTFKGWKIKTERNLNVGSDQQWQLSNNSDNFLGKISETSTFNFHAPATLVSQRYEYKQSVMMKKRFKIVDFDWSTNIATASGKKEGTATLQGGELDRMNHILMLRCQLASGHNEFSFPVMDGNELKTFNYKVIGQELVDTKLGKVSALVVKRIRSNSKRNTTLWFSEELNFMMVKLLQEEHQESEAYVLNIQSYSPIAQTTSNHLTE